MGAKRALTRFLMGRLPVEEQARLVADVIAWRFADLTSDEQREKIALFGPGLMQMMCEGRVGLTLLIFHHWLRLPPCRWLARWVEPASPIFEIC